MGVGAVERDDGRRGRVQIVWRYTNVRVMVWGFGVMGVCPPVMKIICIYRKVNFLICILE